MAYLKKISRPIIYLVCAQALCLTFGLWIHGKLVVSVVDWQAEQQLKDDRPLTDTSPISQLPGEGADWKRSLRKATTPVSAIVFCWTLILQSSVAYLILTRLHVENRHREKRSDEKSLQQTKDLVRTRDAIIFGLAKLAESRDSDTGQHLERIALYSTRLAEALRRHPKFRTQISGQFVRLIGVSSALHDIGKVGIEDSILLKPGTLTEMERKRMQLHTIVGANCIAEIEQRLGNSNFLQMAREIAFYHHEHWDGSGYPRGIKGEDIPLAARIVAVADVYDALTSCRVYKPAFPHEECVDIIRASAGTQFDPKIVEVFLQIEPQIRDIAATYSHGSASQDGKKTLADRDPEFLTKQQAQLLISTVDATTPQTTLAALK